MKKIIDKPLQTNNGGGAYGFLIKVHQIINESWGSQSYPSYIYYDVERNVFLETKVNDLFLKQSFVAGYAPPFDYNGELYLPLITGEKNDKLEFCSLNGEHSLPWQNEGACPNYTIGYKEKILCAGRTLSDLLENRTLISNEDLTKMNLAYLTSLSADVEENLFALAMHNNKKKVAIINVNEKKGVYSLGEIALEYPVLSENMPQRAKIISNAAESPVFISNIFGYLCLNHSLVLDQNAKKISANKITDISVVRVEGSIASVFCCYLDHVRMLKIDLKKELVLNESFSKPPYQPQDEKEQPWALTFAHPINNSHLHRHLQTISIGDPVIQLEDILIKHKDKTTLSQDEIEEFTSALLRINSSYLRKYGLRNNHHIKINILRELILGSCIPQIYSIEDKLSVIKGNGEKTEVPPRDRVDWLIRVFSSEIYMSDWKNLSLWQEIKKRIRNELQTKDYKTHEISRLLECLYQCLIPMDDDTDKLFTEILQRIDEKIKEIPENISEKIIMNLARILSSVPMSIYRSGLPCAETFVSKRHLYGTV